MSGLIQNAARVKPPTTTGGTDISLTGAAATTETATGVGPDACGHWITIACGVAFNIRFGVTGMAAPADVASFPAGVYSFELNQNMTFFRVMPNASGGMTYWRSSY